MLVSSRTRRFPLILTAATCAIAGAAATVGPPLRAQTPARSDIPVFRASTRLVQVDVIVLDRDGRPIRDLQLSDFEIKQGGKPQTLQHAEFVSGGGAAAAPSAMPAVSATGATRAGAGVERSGTSASVAASASEVASTPVRDRGEQADAGRKLIFFVDSGFMHPAELVRVRDALARHVDSLGPRDEVLLADSVTPQTRPWAFTLDRELLRRQIAELRADLSWQPVPVDPDDPRRLCRDAGLSDLSTPVYAYGTFGVLDELFAELRNVPGRKSLFLMAERAVTAPCPDEQRYFHDRARRLGDLANRSGTVIYGLHTSPFRSGVMMPETRASANDVRGPMQRQVVPNVVSHYLQVVSENAGGAARRSNDIRLLLEWATRETGSYYMLAYEPPAGTFEGKRMDYRSLDVKVKRKGAIVRARAGFYNVTDDTLRRQP